MVAKDVLSKIKFRILCIDEAHRLKNFKARIFEELATVPRDFCVLLTGKGHCNNVVRDSLRTSSC
jgi:SNF2 family DNA or RNA helicase